MCEQIKERLWWLHAAAHLKITDVGYGGGVAAHGHVRLTESSEVASYFISAFHGYVYTMPLHRLHSENMESKWE